MNITLKDAVDGFRKQWNWMADETLRQKRKVEKEEYFDTQGIDERDRPILCCYLCEYTHSLKKYNPDMVVCNNCPINWGGKIGNCCSKDVRDDDKGLYEEWEKTNDDYEEAARLAREIANLPLKIKYMNDYENEQN